MKKTIEAFLVILAGLMGTIFAAVQIVAAAIIPTLIIYILFQVALYLSERAS